MRPPLRSQPPSSPSPYRYLGRGGGERPVRVQVILALVAALVLVAVPLYLWRRPQPANIPSADAATMSSSQLLPPPVSSNDPSPQQLVAAPVGPAIQIAPIKTIKCQDPGPGRTPPERCDGIRFFEDSLSRAIRDSASCAPPSKSGYVVSYNLDFHFGKKRANLSLGKSTTLSKSRRKELLRCVERAMQTPDWDRIPHQHLKYTINAIATYPSIAPPEDASPDLAPQAPKPSGGSSKPSPKTAPKKKTPPKTPRKSETTKH